MNKSLKNREKLTFLDSNIFILIAMIFSIIFIITFIIFFSKNIFAISKDYEVEYYSEKINLNELERNSNIIDIEEIIKNKSNLNTEKELVTEKRVLEFTTIYRENPKLPTGYMKVLQEGRDGEEEVITIKTYENEELKEEKIEKVNLLKATVNKIVEVGTSSKYYNFNPEVGDKLYVTSSTLALKSEPDSSSEKICTIYKDAEVELLEKNEDWYKVNYDNYIGFVDKDCLTTKDSNKVEQNDNTQIADLSIDMDLNKPSGLSIEQFKSILEGQEKDINNIFSDNAEYFYYAEKQYNINGVFLAALAIHESSWGTSKLALEKNNLFGYGARDSDPYESAYSFDTYAEGIDLLARVFVKYYINEPGTEIYDGNIAEGKYYNGSDLNGINVRYASDKNWANSIYKFMKYLYNQL